jgi:Zn-dependent protease with chaperone function
MAYLRYKKTNQNAKRRTEITGILSFTIARVLGARPFQSDPLDRLAENMKITQILKRNKLHRYYKVRSLQAGCLSYPDSIFFDTKYYDMLLPDELLAVGAHEFNHISEKHGVKRFARIFTPTLAISALVGLIAFVNYRSLSTITFFGESGDIVSSLLVAMLSLWLLFVASFYFNANWNRQRETQSDLAAVKFGNGEALISALVKLNNLRPNKMSRLESRILPKTYPTIDERIRDIRNAMERKSQEYAFGK